MANLNLPAPVIRLEIEGMRYAILRTFSECQAEMDANVTRVVEEYCKPDNLDRAIEKIAATAIDEAIHQYVRDFFQQGAGRESVRRAVAQRLKGLGAQ